MAGWFLKQIGLLYRVEARLRESGVGPGAREADRAWQSAMVLSRIEKAIRLKLTGHLPRSQMGKALAYTLAHWEQLTQYRDDGRLEIDNNLVENAVRPTAVGKKNWLFFGAPRVGERSAIIYTLLESCKRYGINPQVYLHDVLMRLPSMMITEVAELAPANWLTARRAAQAA